MTGAKIINSHGSKWTIDNTAGSAHELSLKLNSVLAGTIAPDNNATITLNDFALPANEVAHMAAEVKAGEPPEITLRPRNPQNPLSLSGTSRHSKNTR